MTETYPFKLSEFLCFFEWVLLILICYGGNYENFDWRKVEEAEVVMVTHQ